MAPVSTRRLVTIAILLLIPCLYVQMMAGDAGDKQWEMLYAQMWLSGKALYKDLFPVSPPLIFWLYGAPAFMAAKLGVGNPFLLLSFMGFGLVALSVYLCLRLIASHPEFSAKRTKLEFVLLLVFVLVYQADFTFFLDREHLFVTLAMPFMLRFMPSLRAASIPPALRLGAAMLAAPGFCLKPQLFIIWAGIQLFSIASEKSLRALREPENLILYAATLFYLTLIWQLNPQYFTLILPMALTAYSATRDPAPIFFHCLLPFWVLFLGFFCFRQAARSPLRRDILYWLCLCAGGVLYALTGNNWAYTYYPFESAALMVAGFLVWEYGWLDRANGPLAPRRYGLGKDLSLLALGIVAAVSLYAQIWFVNHPCQHDPRCQGDDKLIAIMHEEGDARSFGTISISFSRWTRLASFTGAAWETRFPHLWMLPAFFASGEDFARRNHWILDYVAEGFAQDLNERRPAMLFVDNADRFYAVRKRVDLVEYLSFSGRFREAMGHYHLVKTIEPCSALVKPQFAVQVECRYDIYRRRQEK